MMFRKCLYLKRCKLKIRIILLFLVTLLHTLPFSQSGSNATNPNGKDDLEEILYRELSAAAYFNMPFHEKEDTAVLYRRQYRDKFSDRTWLSKADLDYSQAYDPPAWKSNWGTVVDTDFYNTYQPSKSRHTMHPDAFTIFNLCYAISYMWRRGSKGVHRYFVLRDTYYQHMPFEIGYITQTIMAKYQNVLEVYEYATTLAAQDRRIGRPHLFFLYKNILEDCRTIIHLCNMLHEVTRKYMVLQYSAPFADWLPVWYDDQAKFQEPVGDLPVWYGDKFPKENDPRSVHGRERGVEGHEHEKFRHEDPAMFKVIKESGSKYLEEAEKARVHNIVKKQRMYYNDHGMFSVTLSTSRKTKTWRSNQHMLYGWEPEDDGQ